MKKVLLLCLVFPTICLFLYLSTKGYEHNALAKTKKPEASSQVKTSTKDQISITGKILNISRAKQYLNQNSHIFLHNANRAIRAVLAAGGVMYIFDEGLPKASISEKGDFCFRIDSLEPGQYILFVQPVNGFTSGKLSVAWVVDESTGGKIEVEYPFKKGNSKKMNLKNLRLNVP